MMTYLIQLGHGLSIALEIAILTLIIYAGLRFVRGTRSATILTGSTILLASLTLMAKFFDMEVISWLAERVLALLPFAALIIFQPEIRRALAQIGLLRNAFWKPSEREQQLIVKLLVETVSDFSERRIGALIAIECRVGLRTIIETGTQLNAKMSQELLSTIFHPNTPLHDGGVVLHEDQIVAAGCIFPLTQSEPSKTLGTRHRAAIGLSEETDAVVIIVSEETGRISLARYGRIAIGISQEKLERHLIKYLLEKDTRDLAETSFLRTQVSEDMFSEE
jgi:diadenylate cyclase